MAAPEGGEEPPLPQLAFEPGGHDFGLQPVNSYGGEANFQLRNVGAAPAPVHSLEISGGSGAFWTGGSDCWGKTLNPGEACSIQVHFGPNHDGAFAAQLRASSDQGTTFYAELDGEGGRAILSPATDPTNFGSVPVGSAAVVKTIDVTNTGTLPGGVFIAVISGGAVGSFHLLDENCTGVTITPGATCNVQVSFQPLSAGSKTARLSLFGDGDGGAQIVLSGIGLEPVAAASMPGGGSAVAASTGEPGPRVKSQRRRKRAQRKRHQFRAFVAERQAIS